MLKHTTDELSRIQQARGMAFYVSLRMGGHIIDG
jgi:hypothetical protein